MAGGSGGGGGCHLVQVQDLQGGYSMDESDAIVWFLAAWVALKPSYSSVGSCAVLPVRVTTIASATNATNVLKTGITICVHLSL